jgi:hypothetical protein
MHVSTSFSSAHRFYPKNAEYSNEITSQIIPNIAKACVVASNIPVKVSVSGFHHAL